jgi:hypothetical protein
VPRLAAVEIEHGHILHAAERGIGHACAGGAAGRRLLLNPFGLRDLIHADRSPGAALGLLLFGFVVTFGSTAMGSTIMALGQLPL